METIFLSYSRRDSGYADYIARHIESWGLNAWYDRADIRGGEQWRSSIVNAINSCGAFVLLVSSNSIVSANVRKELDLAEHKQKPVIPLAIENIELPGELQYQLAGVQIVSFWQDRQQGLEDLRRSLSGLQRHSGHHQSSQPEHRPNDTSKADLSNLGGGGVLDRLASGRLFQRRRQ